MFSMAHHKLVVMSTKFTKMRLTVCIRTANLLPKSLRVLLKVKFYCLACKGYV